MLTHNYLDDLAWLAALLPTAAPYVGLLGPAARRDRLLADLAQQGLVLAESMRARLHAPAGLDLGGRATEQVALSIVAEIQAVMNQASAASLSRKPASAATPAVEAVEHGGYRADQDDDDPDMGNDEACLGFLPRITDQCTSR